MVILDVTMTADARSFWAPEFELLLIWDAIPCLYESESLVQMQMLLSPMYISLHSGVCRISVIKSHGTTSNTTLEKIRYSGEELLLNLY
uniref:Neur_chan_LBD domain-containing protein n=1 Tax=Heterorhabditis bacteriophora TaxID=37862 RepID=A0A1I7W8I4_HETBA